MHASDQMLVLIGFPSTGKTAVGKSLARRLGGACIDLDRQLEALYQTHTGRAKRCRAIYTDEGAEAFATYEHKALAALRGVDAAVLATGGGAPVRSRNQPLLRNLGPIIYIKASPETIIARMRAKGAPASLGGTTQHIQASWRERDAVYADLADITIDTDSLTVAQVVEAIVSALNQRSQQL